MKGLDGHLEFYSFFLNNQIEAWGQSHPFPINLVDETPILKIKKFIPKPKPEPVVVVPAPIPVPVVIFKPVSERVFINLYI